MKKIILISITSLFILSAFGQRNKQDVVYLKSGSIITGELIGMESGKVKINSAGNLWVFSSEEIDSIAKYTRERQENLTMKNHYLHAEIGVLAGNSDNNQSAPLSFMFSGDFCIHKTLYAGAGLGFEFLEETYMPAFAQITYNIRNTKFSPFIDCKAGYLIPLEEGHQSQLIYYDYSSIWPGPSSNDRLDTKGGLFVNPSIGFMRFIDNEFGWYFAFGYRYHRLSYTGDNEYEFETDFNRLSIKIGLIFN